MNREHLDSLALTKMKRVSDISLSTMFLLMSRFADLSTPNAGDLVFLCLSDAHQVWLASLGF
jgi:hypothetical protein